MQCASIFANVQFNHYIIVLYIYGSMSKSPHLRIQYFPYFGLRAERRSEIISNCESNKSESDECERLCDGWKNVYSNYF